MSSRNADTLLARRILEGLRPCGTAYKSCQRFHSGGRSGWRQWSYEFQTRSEDGETNKHTIYGLTISLTFDPPWEPPRRNIDDILVKSFRDSMTMLGEELNEKTPFLESLHLEGWDDLIGACSLLKPIRSLHTLRISLSRGNRGNEPLTLLERRTFARALETQVNVSNLTLEKLNFPSETSARRATVSDAIANLPNLKYFAIHPLRRRSPQGIFMAPFSLEKVIGTIDNFEADRTKLTVEQFTAVCSALRSSTVSIKTVKIYCCNERDRNDADLLCRAISENQTLEKVKLRIANSTNDYDVHYQALGKTMSTHHRLQDIELEFPMSEYYFPHGEVNSFLTGLVGEPSQMLPDGKVLSLTLSWPTAYQPASIAAEEGGCYRFISQSLTSLVQNDERCTHLKLVDVAVVDNINYVIRSLARNHLRSFRVLTTPENDYNTVSSDDSSSNMQRKKSFSSSFFYDLQAMIVSSQSSTGMETIEIHDQWASCDLVSLVEFLRWLNPRHENNKDHALRKQQLRTVSFSFKYYAVDEQDTAILASLCLELVQVIRDNLNLLEFSASFIPMHRPFCTTNITINLLDEAELEFVSGILAMNSAGRKYFVDDPSNRVRGIKVLESVTNNLDCLFIHLRENPCLCCCVQQQAFHSEKETKKGKLLRKRRCPEMGTNEVASRQKLRS